MTEKARIAKPLVVDVLELIRSRRTIQSFSSEPVSPETLRTAIEAAVWAPNHKLTYPWLFIEVTPATRNKLAQEQVSIKEKKSGATISATEREAMIKKFLEPSTLLIAAINKSGSAQQQEEDYAAMACAIQNMSLYLWSKGVGSKWGTGGLLNSSKAYELLNLKAEDVKICGLIWIGKPKVVPNVTARPSIDAVLSKR